MSHQSRSVRTSGLLTLLAAALISSAGCAASTPTATPTSTDSTTTAVATDVVAPADAAWLDLAAHIGADGVVTLDTAVEAFSRALAPLPGATGEQSADAELSLDSATSTVRWLGQHFDELTDAQRAAVADALSPPGEQATGVSGLRAAQPISIAPPGCFGERPLQGDAEGTDALRAALKTVLIPLRTRLGDLPAKVWVGFTASGVGPNAQMFSVPYGENCSEGKATSCSILVTDAGRSLAGVQLRALLAREVVHCYEATVSTIAAYEAMPSWLAEGYAIWASEEVVGGSGRPQVASAWQHYLSSPEQTLFSRSYDAVGFFAHMAATDIDTWVAFLPMFLAAGNDAAFTAAIAPSSMRFLDSWPSSFARQPARGFEWDVHAAGAPATSFAVPSSRVANGERIDLSADRTANVLHEIDVAADIVTFLLEANTHGRVGFEELGEGSLNDIVGDGFCNMPTPCICPDGSPPPDMQLGTLPDTRVLLAYTGGLALSRVFVLGTSLEEACQTELDECLVGVWNGYDFRVPGPAGTDLTFIGGEGVVLGVDEDGNAVYDFDQMAPLTYLDTQTGTSVHIASEGIGTGVISTKDGEYEVADVVVSGVTGRSWAEAFGMVVYDIAASPGPAGFVINRGGTYSCQGDLLSFTTTVDMGDGGGIIITLEFSRQ